MQYNEFIQRVQEKASLDSPEEAEQWTKTVLGTFGERLYRTERNKLEAQLPKEMVGFLFTEQEPENTRQDVRRFSLHEFYNRIAARADVRYSTAVDQSQAVMEVLREAVSAGEWDNVRDTLPEDFEELLQPNA